MTPSTALQHRRTHNLLLISKLLSCRENASPFTLILDSLEQSGKGLVWEMIRRAISSNMEIFFVSFETLRKPAGVNIFLQAHEFGAAELQKKISGLIDEKKRSLIILDTLHPLLTSPNINIPTYLSSFTTRTTSLLAVYHTDIPIAQPQSTYSPSPLTLLNYLATTILSTQSLHHVLAQKAARDRSVGEPVFGLGECVEGVLVGLKGNLAEEGVVLEMEYRRKSGRSVVETFFLPLSSPSSSALPKNTNTKSASTKSSNLRETVILLEDHPLYARPLEDREEGNGEVESTFSMGLTEKQRKDREGIVLPYFDAQSQGGAGEGGRILYDYGSGDDFDEEEDDI